MLLKKNERLVLKDFSALYGYEQDNLQSPASGMFNINLDPEDKKNLLHEAQKELIEQALAITEHNKSKAAQILGIPRTSLNSCIQRFDTK